MRAELRLAAAGIRAGARDLLRDVSLEIFPGVTAINGPGASGKTSLLDVLAGLRTADEGRILWRELPLEGAHLHAYREARSYLPALGCQDLHLRVQDVFLTVAAMWRVARPGLRMRRELERWDLLHLRRVPLRRLSGGERRRVLLGASLVMNPGIWIVDQPFSNLDATSRVALQDLLRQVATGQAPIPGLRCVVAAGADGMDLPEEAALWTIDPVLRTVREGA